MPLSSQAQADTTVAAMVPRSREPNVIMINLDVNSAHHARRDAQHQFESLPIKSNASMKHQPSLDLVSKLGRNEKYAKHASSAAH